MSNNFSGVTFENQKVTPAYDAIIRQIALTDGTLTGCAISYTGSTLTMAAGQLMICGRQIVHPTSQNWAVADATTGYARLVITIDLTRASTKDTFDQVTTEIQYATSATGFVALQQDDINTSGSKYQIVACVLYLGASGIVGIAGKLKQSTVVVGSGDGFTPAGPMILTQGVNLFDSVADIPASMPVGALVFVKSEED